MRFRTVLAALAGLAVATTPAVASHWWGKTATTTYGYHWARGAGTFTVTLAATPLSDATAWAGVLSGSTQCTASFGDTTWPVNVANPWGFPSVPGSTNCAPAWTDKSPETATTANLLRTRVVSSTADPKRCSATSGIVVVCDASYGNNGWLGLAQIWLSGSHITAGTAKMNNTYMGTGKPTYGTAAWRKSVMCQEVGHTFGLGHQSENFSTDLDTCMDYFRGADGPNLYPDQHDYNQLATAYGHSDLGTTLATSTATGKAAALPPGAGLRRAGAGDNVWVEDLPNGLRRLVHVRWVDETVEHGPPHDA